MKHFIFLALLVALSDSAFADLYDQRAAEAYRRSQELQEQSQAQYVVNIHNSMQLLANAFGAVHGGTFDIDIDGTKKVRFNSGDGYACEAYIQLSEFQCYEPTGRGAVRFARGEFVIPARDSYFTGIFTLTPKAKSRRRLTPF